MSIRKIETADTATLSGESTSVLRKRCAQVVEIDDSVRAVVQDLRDTLRSDTLSVGLAAPQIGSSLAIAVVNLDKANDSNDIILINPEVISETGQWDEKFESCMSIPHRKGIVKRRKKVVVKYIDIYGKEQEMKATGFEARVILHEIDHLNGILFVDRMDSEHSLEETDLFREHGID